jgi:hypothetical protein
MYSRPTLADLPDDCLGAITEYLDPESIINWDASKKRFHSFFTNNNYTPLSRHLINLFFTLVVEAKQLVPVDNGPNPPSYVPVIEHLVKLFPELLTYRRTVWDHAGRQLVTRTAYQVFLSYADDDLYLMAEKYFKRLPNGEAEMKKQLNEQFPEGIKAYPKYDVEKARAAFRKAFDKFKVDSLISYNNGDNFLKVMSNDTRAAKDEAMLIIKPKPEDEYTIGLVNDMQFYKEWVNIFIKEYWDFKSDAQRDACFVFLLGGSQKYFTANILQILLQGANRVIDDNDPFIRATKTSFRGVEVSPFDPNSKFRLGEDFVIDYWSGQGCGRFWCSVSLSLINYVEQKQQALKNLCSDPNPQINILKW